MGARVIGPLAPLRADAAVHGDVGRHDFAVDLAARDEVAGWRAIYPSGKGGEGYDVEEGGSAEGAG